MTLAIIRGYIFTILSEMLDSGKEPTMFRPSPLKWVPFILLLISSVIVRAQSDVLQVEPFISTDQIVAGQPFKLGLQVDIVPGWHINSNTPNEEFLIPAVFEVDKKPGFTTGDIHYPPAHDVKLFSETLLSAYQGSLVIWIEVKADSTLEPGTAKLSGALKYQACNDKICLLPTETSFELKVSVAEEGTIVREINADRLSATEELGQLEGQRAPADEISALISGKGMSLTLIFIFLGGLALNLTPCVYPIIPITISFFVGQSSGKIGQSFFLALIYVLGMSITYSALGVGAAMTGGLLGSSLQNPFVLMIISGVFLAFAASMFGAFEIRVPAFLNQVAGGSRRGIVGSLIMGLTVGIVAAPCIGPFVLSLLTYVAAKGDPFVGFLLFFVLSMGLGLPYLILGTFSGSVKSLPRSGEWMIWVKKVFGIVMLAMAVYFIATLIPDAVYQALLAIILMTGGLYVGFIEKSNTKLMSFAVVKRLTGAALMFFALWTVTTSWLEANAPRIAWQKYDDILIADAHKANKPVLIDFYADWCLPCKEIDKAIFGSHLVIEQAKSLVALKADLTKENSDQVKRWRQRYKVRGVPTIILLDQNGYEYKRFTDELVDFSPDDFVKIMLRAQPTTGSPTQPPLESF